jgi:hypothetical protein
MESNVGTRLLSMMTTPTTCMTVICITFTVIMSTNTPWLKVHRIKQTALQSTNVPDTTPNTHTDQPVGTKQFLTEIM